VEWERGEKSPQVRSAIEGVTKPRGYIAGKRRAGEGGDEQKT